jgi:hypothetical protein
MREMARLIYRSKKVLIGAAFVIMMVGTGGFLGTLAGVVLALLARTMLAINTGTGEFIAAWALAGSLVTLLLSIYLTMRESGYGFRRTKVNTASPVTVPATDSN